jgi:uncharacterized protein YjaZ
MEEDESDIRREETEVESRRSIRERVLRLKEMIVQKDLSEKLDQKVEYLEMRLLEMNEKVKSISELTKLTMIDFKKYKSTEKWEQNDTVSRKKRPGFTSQFSSCRSVEYSRSPEKGQKEEVREIQTEVQKTHTNRVLFGNPGKRSSRLLLREFINKNFDQESKSKKMLSPFEKKVEMELGKRQVEIKEDPRESMNEIKGLELENIRLKNQLDNEVEKRKKLERDLEEGKEGLESLLESMPRKVKQSPLLKMSNKHFSEVLELVKFQVEEYKDAIKEYKEKSRKEFSIEGDSDGERTEDLVGTSVMNSRNPSYCDTDENPENGENEISITDVGRESEGKKEREV